METLNQNPAVESNEAIEQEILKMAQSAEVVVAPAPTVIVNAEPAPAPLLPPVVEPTVATVEPVQTIHTTVTAEMPAIVLPTEVLKDLAEKPKAKQAKQSKAHKKAASPEEIDLNKKEEKVFTLFLAAGPGRPTPKSIEALTVAFPSKNKSQANSWVRNSLRKLVKYSMIEKVGKGLYLATQFGRKIGKAKLSGK